MGMKSGRQGTGQTGTSSFPVTGFPSSAYNGNNRIAGGRAERSVIASPYSLGNIANYNKSQYVIVIAVLIALGYITWHLDNK